MGIDKLKENYIEYCKSEFGDCNGVDFTNGELDIMFTTVGNEEYEVQVSYNYKEEYLQVSLLKIEDNTVFIYREKESVDDMANELESGDFQGWYSYAHSIVDSKFKTDQEIEF